MSAVDLNKICDTIYDWIASRNLVDKQKIYLEDPNVDRPTPPSISYRFLTLPTKIGSRDDIEYSGSGDIMTVSGPRDFTMSLKVYGETSQQIVSDLKESLELFSVQQIFQAANLAVRNAGTPTDVSLELETGIEHRYSLDIVLGTMSIQSEDQGAIETVNIVDAKVKDVTGADKQTVNAIIDKP